ncbi:hypothetical protein GH714_024722 [Hevea brasiliensis]|uniref:Uncharacterized protein n=1 Tax=Hevea brasiliensis TaxID=3981 RepID=A0A6A6KS81_HEVBR|nr:hypothetical protein GH714_024722 [Hevea brasiliensis]
MGAEEERRESKQMSSPRMQMPQLEKLKQLGNVQKILAAGTVQMNGLELFLLEPGCLITLNIEGFDLTFDVLVKFDVAFM